MSNQFRAILLPNECISISEVDEKGVVVRHVATIEKTAVWHFLEDVRQITDTLKSTGNDTPKEPTLDQCTLNEIVYETEYKVGYAIWYPQMGGYSGRAVAVMDRQWVERENGSRSGGCIDVYVWHDGEFPFSEDGRNPYLVHHCDPDQFVGFGEMLEYLNEQGKVKDGGGAVDSQEEPEQVITMTMGTDGRLQIDGATEIKLTVGEPAVFVRRQ